MVEPCSGIKTCKSIKVSKFNFRPGIPFDAPRARFVCKRKYKSIFQCATERAKSRKRRREQDTQPNEMILHLAVPMLNDDRRSRLFYIRIMTHEHTQSRLDLLYARSQSFSQPTQEVLCRVSHVSSFYRVCMRFRDDE